MLQDDLYQPNHYLSLMEFREQTLQRLKKFCEQRFFSVADYTKGVHLQAASCARNNAYAMHICVCQATDEPVETQLQNVGKGWSSREHPCRTLFCFPVQMHAR